MDTAGFVRNLHLGPGSFQKRAQRALVATESGGGFSPPGGSGISTALQGALP